MKRLLFILVMSVILLLAFGACSKTEDVNSPEAKMKKKIEEVEKEMEAEANEKKQEESEKNIPQNELEGAEQSVAPETILDLEKDEKEVAMYAIDGFKSYYEADYTDEDYDGKNGSEAFEIGFRDSIIISKAKERVQKIKEEKIKRSIKFYSFESVDVSEEKATVKIKCEIDLQKNGKKSKETTTFSVKLSNKGGGVWYISSVDPIIFP